MTQSFDSLIEQMCKSHNVKKEIVKPFLPTISNHAWNSYSDFLRTLFTNLIEGEIYAIAKRV
jgi:hypothetical protein